MKTERCRHSKVWILANSSCTGVTWCYECGAIRINKAGEKWTKPVGKGGENPAIKESGKYESDNQGDCGRR